MFAGSGQGEPRMKPQLLLTALFVANGLLIAALAIPMGLGRVPRNGWYGFRVPKTLASDDVWYPTNQFMGRDLLVAGVVLTAGSLLLLPFAARLTVDAVAWIGLALTVVPLAVALYRGFRFLAQL